MAYTNLIYKGSQMDVNNLLGGGNTGITIAVILIVIIIIVTVVVVVVITSSSTTSTPTSQSSTDSSNSGSSDSDDSSSDSSTSTTPTPSPIDYTQYFDKSEKRWCAWGNVLQSVNTINDDNRQTALKNCVNDSECYQVNEVSNQYDRFELLGFDSFSSPCDSDDSSDVLWIKKGPATSVSDYSSAGLTEKVGICANNVYASRLNDTTDDTLLLAINACYNDSKCYQVGKNVTNSPNSIYLVNHDNTSDSCYSLDTGNKLYYKA